MEGGGHAVPGRVGVRWPSAAGGGWASEVSRKFKVGCQLGLRIQRRNSAPSPTSPQGARHCAGLLSAIRGLFDSLGRAILSFVSIPITLDPTFGAGRLAGPVVCTLS